MVKKSKNDLYEEVDMLKKKVDTLEKIAENLLLKVNKLLSEAEKQKKPRNDNPINFTCEVCDYTCAKMDDLKTHKVDKHQRVCPPKKCSICGETFAKNHELETHLKKHKEAEKFYCNICGKEFLLCWRLEKHMKVHVTTKYCHYYNNRKTCPFEDIGCKFRHDSSSICKFKKCLNSLCQFKHEIAAQNENEMEHDAENIDTSVPEYYKNIGYTSFEDQNIEVESNHFKTSTPKRRKFECEECVDQSECVDCIVKRYRGENGGVTTALCTRSAGCSEMGSFSCSTSR